MDILTIMDKFNTDEKCREALEKLRLPNGVTCTRCGVIGAPELPGSVLFQCKSCRYQFSVTSGTIMHDSHLPIRKWFLAVYLMCVSKCACPRKASRLTNSSAPSGPHTGRLGTCATF